MQDNPFDLIPAVDFVPKTTDALLEEMVADYEQAWYELTGEQKSLAPSSEEQLFLYTQAARFHTAYQLIDLGCKMNLLKYSREGYLDNLAALFGLSRLPAQYSVSRARFSLSAVQKSTVAIPAGTRISTPDGIYFATRTPAVVAPGELSVEVDIRSVQTGASTAGIAVGRISVLVDPIPFVMDAVNVLSTQGGTDVENDDSLRLRVYYFKDSWSVAGPECAYRYFVQSFSQAIEGISVHSPEPGAVDIRITLTGGELPEQPFLNSLTDYLEDKRPLTDRLTISAPDTVEFDVECTYYIARSDRGRQDEIREAVSAAVERYLAWQCSRIGRDITPDMLIRMVVEAGAKRVPVASPVFTTVGAQSICKATSCTVVFGGIEDD